MERFLKSLLVAIFAAVVAFAPAHADDLCKNLFNKSDFLSLSGYFVNMYGNLINGGGNTTIIFPVQPNTTYTFSWDGYGGGRIAQFEDLPSSGGTAGTNVGNFYNGGTVTTANATNYIAIHFQKTDSALQPFIDSLQQEQGSTATSYVPYNPLCATCQGIVRSGKWNQLMNGTKIASWSTWRGVNNKVDNTTNNYVSFDFSGDSVWNVANNFGEDFTVSDHKYYVTTLVTSSETITRFYLAYAVNTGTVGFNNTSLQANTQTRVSGLTTGTGHGLGFEFQAENAGSMTVKDFQVFDLTDMFGAGNEPSTVAAAEAAIAQRASELGITANNGYYEYYASGDYSYCADAIKIATTAYNDAQFAPVETALNSTVSTIKNVVANTITQTAAIAQIASDKQTRPDSECPAGKTCLLVEDADGTPHWYEIIEEYIPPE